MRARDALEELRRYAAVRGKDVSAADVLDVLDLMTEFYREVRADDCVCYIWHLDPGLKFKPSPELRALGHGDHGCHSLAELDEFTVTIRASPAWGLVRDRSDGHATLLYECAG